MLVQNTNKLILDACAWIEYLSGTEKGKRIRDELTKPLTMVHTTGMIVAEVITKRLKEGKPTDTALLAMKSIGIIVPMDFSIGEQTAHIYVQQRARQKKFGLVDAHVVAVAKAVGAKVITCDLDFSGLPNVLIVQ